MVGGTFGGGEKKSKVMEYKVAALLLFAKGGPFVASPLIMSAV